MQNRWSVGVVHRELLRNLSMLVWQLPLECLRIWLLCCSCWQLFTAEFQGRQDLGSGSPESLSGRTRPLPTSDFLTVEERFSLLYYVGFTDQLMAGGPSRVPGA